MKLAFYILFNCVQM